MRRQLVEQRRPVGERLRGRLVLELDLSEVERDVRRDVDRAGIARGYIAERIGIAGADPGPAAGEVAGEPRRHGLVILHDLLGRAQGLVGAGYGRAGNGDADVLPLDRLRLPELVVEGPFGPRTVRRRY